LKLNQYTCKLQLQILFRYSWKGRIAHLKRQNVKKNNLFFMDDSYVVHL